MFSTIQKTKVTPPQLAAEWGISTTKILNFIKSGELKALNAASPGKNQRPRYLIDLADLADFERRRTTGPAPKIPQRRSVADKVGDYY